MSENGDLDEGLGVKRVVWEGDSERQRQATRQRGGGVQDE